MDEDRLLSVQAEDLISKCSRQDAPGHTGFLDPAQQSQLRKQFKDGKDEVSLIYYGGYSEAERVVMACLPYYMTDTYMKDAGRTEPAETGGDEVAEEDSAGTEYFRQIMTVIRATVPRRSAASGRGRPLSHGDYLGALMGLGIKRNVIGDIIVTDEGADIIVLKDMADFLLMNFVSAGKARVTTCEVPLEDLRLPEKLYDEIRDTVASLRLDAVLASAFRMSRGKAAEAVRQGIVFVDHIEATKPDMSVAEGTELVIRHRGKAKLLQAGRRTRKDRISITIARYSGNTGK